MFFEKLLEKWNKFKRKNLVKNLIFEFEINGIKEIEIISVSFFENKIYLVLSFSKYRDQEQIFQIYKNNEIKGYIFPLGIHKIRKSVYGNINDLNDFVKKYITLLNIFTNKMNKIELRKFNERLRKIKKRIF